MPQPAPSSPDNADAPRPIVVTGGAGFVGANFIREWLATERTPVIALDKLTYAGNLDNLAGLAPSAPFEFIRGDIGDVERVRALLARARPRAIVNFAAESHVDRSIHGPAAFVDTNIVGTFHLLQCVREHLDSLRPGDREAFRFLHVSTDEVYGSLSPEAAPFREGDSYRPNSPYAASKAASDHLMRAWHNTYGVPVVVSNSSNTFGPLQFPEKLIPLMICNALKGLPLPVYGDGLQVRDWLYVGDHCAALRLVLENGRPGESYNIGGANEKCNLDVVHAVCDLLDRARPRDDRRSYRDQIAFVADRPGHDRRYAIDASRIRTELGWSPGETFASGLGRTVEWYLGNGAWLERLVTRDRGSWAPA